MTEGAEDVASRLLAGPRGRRLCLQVAVRTSPSVGRALFWLAHQADGPQRSTLLTFGDGGSGEEPDYTCEQLADRIRSVTTVRLGTEAVHDALRDSVDAARYWQEPDGADKVAAQPEVRAALVDIARAIIASPVAESWDRSPTTEQWAVDWRPAPDDASVLVNSAAVLADWDRDHREDEETAKRERSHDARALFSGTWWSFPTGLSQTRGSVHGALDLQEDSFGPEFAIVTPVRGTGRICEIRSAEDWARLCRRHPAEVTASRRHDWFRVTGRDGRWLIPDWSRVALEWDAVHLSVLGYLNAATTLIPVDREYASVIAGWGPDSTLWLTDVVRKHGPRQRWTRQSGADAWTREDPDIVSNRS